MATAHHTKGLTAAKVAKAMYTTWWSPDGLPSVLTSDRGPHFAGAWWRTMCSLHGVRQSFAQAYHHEGNGRAERIGAQLQVKLRKLQAEEGVTWMQSLQRAVRLHNDSAGPSGLSPYEILYGRHRPMAGVPYEEPARAEDAVAFFDRQAAVDKKVADVMRDIHEKRMEVLNRRRRELPALTVDQKVWYLRPRGRSGEKLESYWIGPCVVRERRGEHSYVVEVEPGRLQEAHRSQLKEHFDDVHGEAIKNFHYRQAIPVEDAAMDEWNVEAIEDHKIGEDGYPEFLVRWEGSDERTWEPLRHFFHRYSLPVMTYCSDKRLELNDVLGYLYRTLEMAVNAITFGWEDPPLDWKWGEDIEQNDNLKTTMENKTAAEYHRGAEPSVFHGVWGRAVKPWQPVRVDVQHGWTKAIDNTMQWRHMLRPAVAVRASVPMARWGQPPQAR